MGEKVREINSEKEPGVFLFFCPGCGYDHNVFTKTPNSKGAIWSFNGNLEKPTFEPSLLLKNGGSDLKQVCHTFIRNGEIQYLTDCGHWLAGYTMEIPDYPEESEYMSCDCGRHLPKRYIIENPAQDTRMCMFCDPAKVPVAVRALKYLIR